MVASYRTNIFELYRIWCKYAIEMGDIFVWAYTVVKWSYMARTISIALGPDSLLIKYCDSKAYKKLSVINKKLLL